MAAQALLHELLLALVGHTGECVQPVLQPIAPAAGEQSDATTEFTVVGLELLPELHVTPADRTAINTLLKCGYHYATILHFTQSVDEGATIGVYQLPKSNELNSVAKDPSQVQRLEAQQARSVFSAGSQMLSPPKLRRPPAQNTQHAPHEVSESQALVPINRSLHPLLDGESDGRTSKKSVGLYLRALVQGLDEILTGYRTLILHIEQEILREQAEDPDSVRIDSNQGGYGNKRIDFGLTKLNLMLRQYMVILPALHEMVKKITNASSSDQPLSPTNRSNILSIHGCALLSFLHNQSLTGVPILSQVYRTLLGHLEQVLLQQSIQWMFYGLLMDPFEEFWIRKNTLSSPVAQFQSSDAQQHQRTGSTVFDSLHLFDSPNHASGASSSTSNTKQPSFDWDTLYTIVPALLPAAYFPTPELQHNILFLGKAIKVLMEGEKQREMRERREQQQARSRRRRGSQATEYNNTPLPSAKTRSSRRTASISISLLPPRPASGRNQDGSSRVEQTLREALAPLLGQFHALRNQSGAGGNSATAARSIVSQSHVFESLTASLTALVSKRLYEHLLYDHSLLLHLDHLRRFVLLGDGTFIESFLDSLGPPDLLDRPCTARTVKWISSKQSNAPMILALKEAGLKEEGEEDDEGELEDEQAHISSLHNYPLKHLTFTLDQSNTTATSAWKQLGFTYHFPSPTLELIFTKDILEKYTQIMRFHLECRRVYKRLKELRVQDLVPKEPIGGRGGIGKHPRGGSSSTSSGTGNAPSNNNPIPSPDALFSYHLLRHRMFYFLSTLCSYVAYDVLEGCHAKLFEKLSPGGENTAAGAAAVKEFEHVRKAQEECLNAIIGYCFLRDRVVSGALSDLFATCLQFCSLLSSSSLTAASFTRLSGEYDRQSCFLFTVLSRKTDFQGGSGSFLHSLVSKLDFNGSFTRQSKDLGLNATKTKALVPAARGMVVSSEGIQTSLSDGPRRNQSCGGSGGISTTNSVQVTSVTATPSVTHMTQQLTRAPASTFTPSATLNSQASYFASANTRPASAARPLSGTNASVAAQQQRPFTSNGPRDHETY